MHCCCRTSLAMVTGRHIVGMMASRLGSGEGGKAAAAIVREAEALDWNAWFSHAGGAQTAQGKQLSRVLLGEQGMNSTLWHHSD